MARNKLSKELEQVAREKGILGDTPMPRVTPSHRLVQAEETGKPLAFPPAARLTLPPSTNNLFINKKGGRGRVKSPQYRAWVEDNLSAARRVAKPDSFPVRVRLTVCGKVNARRDLDNIIKPALDLIVAAKVIPDDSVKYVTGGRWEYAPSDDEPHVLVWLEEIA